MIKVYSRYHLEKGTVKGRTKSHVAFDIFCCLSQNSYQLIYFSSNKNSSRRCYTRGFIQAWSRLLGAPILHRYLAEYQSARLEQRTETAIQARAPELLHEAAVSLEEFQVRCVVPHVTEGQLRKLAAPAESVDPRAQEGQDVVAELLAAVEARVGAFEDAWVTVSALWFADDILPRDL